MNRADAFGFGKPVRPTDGKRTIYKQTVTRTKTTTAVAGTGESVSIVVPPGQYVLIEMYGCVSSNDTNSGHWYIVEIAKDGVTQGDNWRRYYYTGVDWDYSFFAICMYDQTPGDGRSHTYELYWSRSDATNTLYLGSRSVSSGVFETGTQIIATIVAPPT